MFMVSQITRHIFKSHDEAKVKQEDKEWRWNDNSNKIVFQLLHTGNPYIYAYRHELTLAASGCPANLYTPEYVKNSCIFNSKINYAVNKNYEKLYFTIAELLCNTEVVPLWPVVQVLDEAKCDLGQTEGQAHHPEEEGLRHRLTLEKLESTLARLSQKTTAKIQLNDWFTDGILAILEKDLNLVVHSHNIRRSLPESLISVFGKSQPDLCFYPSYKFDKVTALDGIILSADVTDEAQVVGGVAEFKSSKTPCGSQAFANLVRYGVYLVEEQLSRGYIIDRVYVMGILASHQRGMFIPIKLTMDFPNNKTQFMEGEMMAMTEGFVVLVYNTINLCPQA